MRVTDGETAVAVFDVGGELVALEDRCLHRGGSLSSGLVRDGTVTCPEHFWRYELATGRRVGAPWLCLRRHRVERDGEGIRVAMPATPTACQVGPAAGGSAPRSSMREMLLRHAREWERG